MLSMCLLIGLSVPFIGAAQQGAAWTVSSGGLLVAGMPPGIIISVVINIRIKF